MRPSIFSLFVVFLLFPTAAHPKTMDQRVDKIEKLISSLGETKTFDGVVPERTIVYQTSNSCQEIKKTKMYFDAIHPFSVISRVKCANKVFLVIRWFEKDNENQININTVLKDDVILAP